jgi:DNA-binding GntR family transcriptional regulator
LGSQSEFEAVAGDDRKTRTAVTAIDERGSLSEDVYARLKQSIFDFRMPPGQRYSEHELAAELQVSRTPLRLALHVLAHEGYVRNLGGHSAWQVRPLDLVFYEDLYDFRVEIEATALRLASVRDHGEDVAALVAVWCVPLADRISDGNVVAELDETFHRTLVSLGGNQAMLRSFEELTERIRIIRRLDFISPERVSRTYDEHSEILRALGSGDAEKAEGLVRQHIAASRVEIRRLTLHRLSLARQSSPSSEEQAPKQVRGADR